MTNATPSSGGPARKTQTVTNQITIDHYLRMIFHRKWIVIATFLVVSAGTAIVTYRMADVYTSQTVILVDPQKVPETYVKPTVTGDVRNRLGTLSQQILSASRLQKVIESLNLYPVERKTLPREDVILKMQSDISVQVVTDFGGSQDLQAFRIRYSGSDPGLVARVANELATQFIDENLRAREAQANSTTDFLQGQLQAARRTLEAQETKLRDFRLKHVGEMPEQQAADLQILGQLQSQSQLVAEALSRAEQQKAMLQAMQTQSSTVVELDEPSPVKPPAPRAGAAPAPSKLDSLRSQLAAMEGKYTSQHPGVRKLKGEIAAEEAKAPQAAPAVAAAPPQPEPAETPRPARTRPAAYGNPVLQSQLKAVEDEIAKQKQEQGRLAKLIGGYQRKIESIPVNEQIIAALVRDYDISKAHYQQLLNNQLSAETATQLEINQKSEKFTVLDYAQAPERPSRPNRPLINAAGSLGGLALGLFLAVMTEFLGLSITAPEHVTETTNLPVLETIPLIETRVERRIRRRRLIWVTASAVVMLIAASGAFLIIRFRT